MTIVTEFRSNETDKWRDELAWQSSIVGVDRMAEIRREVAEKHGLNVADLLRKRRRKDIVAARHEAMFRIYEETSASLPQIGRFFGGFDHTTVLYAVHKLRQQRMREGA